MQFLDVKTDYAFKKVFGSDDSKPRLINFLNSIIYEQGNVYITDLSIEDPYNIPLLKGMKDTFVDVKATLNNATTVIIEMQVLNHNGFEKRVLYNAAKNYSIQLNRSEDYHLLNPVIALTLVDFTMFKESKKYINRFKLLEKEEFIHYNDDIELIFVELPKFKKELEFLNNIQDQWIYFIKNAGSLEFIPTNFDSNIQKALDCVNEAGLSKKELEMQHKRKEFISIQKLAVMKANQDGFDSGHEKGIEQGIEQGIEKGRIEERNKLIIKAYQNGTPTSLISSFVDISEEEIIEFLRGVENL